MRMVTRVELGRRRPHGEAPAQQHPRSRRRARRLPAPALGAIIALMVAAAGWPGMASASVHSTSPGPGPASTAGPWLLGPTAPALLPVATASAITPDAYVSPLQPVRPI